MRIRIKTILVVIALLAAYMAFARLFLGNYWGELVLAMVTIFVVGPITVGFLLAGIQIAFFEPKRPAQRPTAEDRSLDEGTGPRPSR